MGERRIVAAVLALVAVRNKRSSPAHPQHKLLPKLPFGPFRPSEKIEIRVSLTNTSADHTATFCEGPCIGDSFTYSVGGLESIPSKYSFYFGDKKTEAVFDGQIAGVLVPGEERDFVFGFYDPIGTVSPGL